MRFYFLESKSYRWLLYLAIGLIALYVIAKFASSQTGHSSLVNIVSATLDVLFMCSIPVAAVIAGNVAHKMNRSVLFWGIFTLLFAPIALIILSFKKNYVSPELIPIYQEYEVIYLKAISELKIDLRNGIISDEDLIDKLIIIRKELELEMNQKIQKMEAETSEHLNSSLLETSNCNTSGGEVTVPYDKCPACGNSVANSDFECSDCGLRLK